MDLKQFVDKYNGKPIDFDKHYGAQCTDLYRQYVKEVLELPQSPPVVGAKDIWTSMSNDYTRHLNKPESIPQPGDIMIWGEALGNTYGHVSVFLHGGLSNFTSFDQNWPVGSLCHEERHDYKHVLGWFRKRGTINEMDKIAQLEEEVRKLNTELGVVTPERDAAQDAVEEEIRQHKETIKTATDNYNKWQFEIERANKAEQKLENIIETVNELYHG